MRSFVSRGALALALFGAFAASPADAQVGYPPAESPFRDLEYRQEITPFAGWYAASKDPAGVAPQSGPMIGARYEVRIGGPAQLLARAAAVFSERTEIDPTRPAAQRVVGTSSQPLFLADLGIALNLTGQKSYHHFVPVVNAGIGIASDFQGEDVGGFKFGTPFAFSFGGGVRWTPGTRFQLRVDVTDYLYQIDYPDSYFVPASDNTQAVANSQGSSSWRHNAAITVGASYLFFR